MASKAYLEAMNSIPSDIKEDVIGSIEIANEIHSILEKKGMSNADLARLLNKSESEISKWLTGLHNFTFKTVRKIGIALGEELVIPKSKKISEYQAKIDECEKQISILKRKNYLLKKEIENNTRHVSIFVDNYVCNGLSIKPSLSSGYLWSFSREKKKKVILQPDKSSNVGQVVIE